MKLKKGKEVEKMAKKNVAKKKKKNIAEMTTDDFFNQDFENMDLSDDEDEKETPVKNVTEAAKKSDIKKEKSVKKIKEAAEKSDIKNEKPVKKVKKAAKKSAANDELEDIYSGDSDLDPVEHRKSLMKLKDTDPEFFKYLIQNDKKLLDFNVDDDPADNLPSDEVYDDLKHIPDDDLEVASDESDYEANAKENVIEGGPVKVTFKMLKKWQEEIQTDKTSKTIKNVVEAFHAALETISDSESQTGQYKVEGGAIFNGIIQLCLMFLPDAFKKFLKIGDESHIEIHKFKRFSKVKGVLKSYLLDLLKVFENVSSANIITVLLKHLHQMLPYTQSFSSLRKPLLRILLKYWSTAEEETVRVISFLCIVRIATIQPTVINGLMKTMYIKYVENSKFVSPTTLPGINFMRRSLTEFYGFDDELAYYNAFLYIRQLAIHLRNALTLKKKEHFQAVYNWQYIHSLWFWSDLMSASRKNSSIRSLLYPLVQITIGVVKLIPTAQYYPLRFHCVKMLINISKETGTFIPSLPFLVEILDTYDFNKRHKTVSMKPISLMCLLKASKSQMVENGYKDAIIENVYELILESAAKDSYTLYFPDMYIPCIIKLKAFLKKCHVPNYTRKMKQLLDKIEEGRKFIEAERAKHPIDLKDMTTIENVERKIKEAGTPVSKFYDSWIKVYQSQKLKLLTKNDEIADIKVPQIRKKKRTNKQGDSDENSDLDVPVEEMERRLNKQKQKKKKSKKLKMVEDVELPREANDIVQDIKDDDWD